jgi:tRNA A-37 threonylcarbamoyl transferase component Bud32
LPFKETRPTSKYKITVALEQKKQFMETDLIEAVDYGERLLSIQSGRSLVYTGLFHCCGQEKIIRWVRVAKENDQFATQITGPASLKPGEDGLRQLLTVMCATSETLGLSLPHITLDGNRTLDVDIFLGEGATSRVYRAILKTESCVQKGVVKVLGPGYCLLANAEARALKVLHKDNVPLVPACQKLTDTVLFFSEVLEPIIEFEPKMLKQLLATLKSSHKNNVFHRDVRPENLMLNEVGDAVLNDWGCATTTSTKQPFAGTFRYACDSVLQAAIDKSFRVPTAADDLHALVRTVLAIVHPYIRRKLASVYAGKFSDAKHIWQEVRANHENWEVFFLAADQCDYEALSGLI